MGPSWAGLHDVSWTLLDEIICDRIATFPEKARRLLDLLAVAGRPLELSVARQVAFLEGDDLRLVDELRLGHLVRTRETGGRHLVELYQDRIRRALVDRMTSRTLRDYHLRLAFALESGDQPDPEALAMHLLEGGERWLAAKQAVAAADRAAEALASDLAARLYRMALDLGVLPDDERREVGLRLAEVLAAAGQ
jgi:hypothetical protein